MMWRNYVTITLCIVPRCFRSARRGVAPCCPLCRTLWCISSRWQSRDAELDIQQPRSVKAKFHYASWFGAGSEEASVMEFGFYQTGDQLAEIPTVPWDFWGAMGMRKPFTSELAWSFSAPLHPTAKILCCTMLFQRPDSPKVSLLMGTSISHVIHIPWPGPTRLNIQNCIVIGSAVIAQLK